jgi:16S rRNA processing protein RimM
MRNPEPRYLVVGQVSGAHGLRGELKVAILTDDPHRFGLLDTVFVGLQDEEPEPRHLEGYRIHKGNALLKVEGCDDRAAAEELRGALVQVLRTEAIPLREGEYFEHQILGLDAWTASGERLGKVVEIIYTGANDVYVVRSPDPGHGEILIPSLEDVVLEIDLETGRLVVELPAGLL